MESSPVSLVAAVKLFLADKDSKLVLLHQSQDKIADTILVQVPDLPCLDQFRAIELQISLGTKPFRARIKKVNRDHIPAVAHQQINFAITVKIATQFDIPLKILAPLSA